MVHGKVLLVSRAVPVGSGRLIGSLVSTDLTLKRYVSTYLRPWSNGRMQRNDITKVHGCSISSTINSNCKHGLQECMWRYGRRGAGSGGVWVAVRCAEIVDSFTLYPQIDQQKSTKPSGNVAEWLTRLTRNDFKRLSDQFPSGAHVRIMPLS